MAVFIRMLFGTGELFGDGFRGAQSRHHEPAVPAECIVRAGGVTCSP
ncbi:hypothetical protein ACOJVU_03280 [Mycobacterium sp. THU-M104]